MWSTKYVSTDKKIDEMKSMELANWKKFIDIAEDLDISIGSRQVWSDVKVLLTVLFDCSGVVHHEFLPKGNSVNNDYYLQVRRNLR